MLPLWLQPYDSRQSLWWWVLWTLHCQCDAPRWQPEVEVCGASLATGCGRPGRSVEPHESCNKLNGFNNNQVHGMARAGTTVGASCNQLTSLRHLRCAHANVTEWQFTHKVALKPTALTRSAGTISFERALVCRTLWSGTWPWA